MNRILVTGNAGSGKTTLSLRLGAALGLPVVHLDQVVWRPGWEAVPKSEIAESVEKIVSEPAWIIDGVSSRACEVADTIIFLDVPVHVCLRRALRRTFRHLFRQRRELPRNCPEWRITWRMARIIFAFPRHTRPRILASARVVRIGHRFDSARIDTDGIAGLSENPFSPRKKKGHLSVSLNSNGKRGEITSSNSRRYPSRTPPSFR